VAERPAAPPYHGRSDVGGGCRRVVEGVARRESAGLEPDVVLALESTVPGPYLTARPPDWPHSRGSDGRSAWSRTGHPQLEG